MGIQKTGHRFFTQSCYSRIRQGIAAGYLMFRGTAHHITEKLSGFVDNHRDIFTFSGKYGRIQRVSMNNGINILSGSEHCRMHRCFNGGLSVSVHNISEKIGDNDILFTDGIVWHTARCQINQLCFRISDADIAEG